MVFNVLSGEVEDLVDLGEVDEDLVEEDLIDEEDVGKVVSGDIAADFHRM